MRRSLLDDYGRERWKGKENGKVYRREVYNIILRTLHIEPVTRRCAFTDDVRRFARVQTGVVPLDRLEAQLGAPHGVVQQCRFALH